MERGHSPNPPIWQVEAGTTLHLLPLAPAALQDELLGSVLALLLTAPRELLGTGQLDVPLRLALEAGRQYTPLAEAAVGALERWQARPFLK
jgi:hypothetical protein